MSLIADTATGAENISDKTLIPEILTLVVETAGKTRYIWKKKRGQGSSSAGRYA